MNSTDTQGFRLPDLGEGLTEAEIVAWYVAPGDHVVADQPLLTVETDKAVVDVPAPQSGRVAAIHAASGERLPVGALLVTWADETGGSDVADRGAVVGELVEAPVETTSTDLNTAGGKPDLEDLRGVGVSVSPRARRRAQALNIDLSAVHGTGLDGTISLKDVESFAEIGTGEPLRGVRRAMAERMADAHRRVARATVTGEADISRWKDGQPPILRLIRSVGAACDAQPRLNARFDDRSLSLTQQTAVHLGIAMETKDGLFAPVLENVTSLTAPKIAARLEQLESAVSNRTIRPAELRGQTITLSNFGAVAGLHAEMVVVPPQVAIVGAGRAFERKGGGAGELMRILPLSVSFDHRVVTGVEACEFLVALSEDLEKSS